MKTGDTLFDWLKDHPILLIAFLLFAGFCWLANETVLLRSIVGAAFKAIVGLFRKRREAASDADLAAMQDSERK